MSCLQDGPTDQRTRGRFCTTRQILGSRQALLHPPNPELCLLFFLPKDGCVLRSVGGCGRGWGGKVLTLLTSAWLPPPLPAPIHTRTQPHSVDGAAQSQPVRAREPESRGAHPGSPDLQDKLSAPNLAVIAPGDILPLPHNGFL